LSGAAHDSSALLAVTPRSPRGRVDSFSVSGQTRPGLRPFLGFALRSGAISPARRFGASCCHASPIRDAPLPSDSGHKQARFAALGLFPSLQSRLAAHNGSALLSNQKERSRDPTLTNTTFILDIL